MSGSTISRRRSWRPVIVPPLTTDDISYRQLTPTLWVIRRSDRPLGMIEHGRRYTAMDSADREIGRFRTFDEARAALERLP